MRPRNESTITKLVGSVIGTAAAEAALSAIELDAAIGDESGPRVSRATFAMALGVILFEDLLTRVPSGASYVARRRAAGERIIFDHGALRTVRFAHGPTGALPPGQDAFARILEPLGYVVAGVYPLPQLKMTGRAYRNILSASST
jgi:hypothetical protein